MKIALLGYGHLGKIHAKCIAQTDFDLIGVYDPNPDLEIVDYKRYSDLEALIRDADAIDIVATTATHYELAAKCIAEGKHVFVEKPFVQNLDQAKKIESLLMDQDLVFQIGHVERFNPAYQELKKKNISPKFIEGHRLATFNPRGTDVSVILDLMIHDIDLILDLVQEDIYEIRSSGVSIISDSLDICNARIEFTNGCVANLTASRISMKQMRKLRIFQEDAYVSIDFMGKETQIFRLFDEDAIPTAYSKENLFALDKGKEKKYVVMESPEIKSNNAIVEELNEFYHAVVNNKTVTVGIAEGVRSLEVATMIANNIRYE